MQSPSLRKRPHHRRKVALLIETSNAYARGLLQGVVSYIREHQPWSFYLMEQGRGDDPPSWLAGWHGDGIIARVENRKIARAVARTGLPAVDLSAARLAPNIPWVETDDEKIAQLAAEHLLERGFRHFAFCGDARFNWSQWRGQHFVAQLRDAGHQCHVYAPHTPAKDLAQQIRQLVRWLKHLPKPLGVMSCYDIRGQQVLDACRLAGFDVPDEVAVISVDNDALLCELAAPPMSSVIPNTHRTGYEAAALLDDMMNGKKVAPVAHLIPPLGIAARRSTDVLAIEDRTIARVLRFIREHACDDIHVADLLPQVNMTRRTLEQKFKQLLGRTPREEILSARLRRVKELLSNTDLSLNIIAEQAGFKHTEYLSVFFKRETGVTPSDYRDQTRY